MDAQTKIIRASHMIDMNDIIREGNPTLRAVAEDVTFPLSDEDIILGEKMMQFLRNSQDPVIAEKMGLRGRSCSPTIRYFKTHYRRSRSKP